MIPPMVDYIGSNLISLKFQGWVRYYLELGLDIGDVSI